MRRLLRGILITQGIYYLLTGLWPIVHLPSFEAVTGPKTDDWLVQTVGALVLAIAVGMLTALRQPKVPLSTITLAAGCCVAFITIDVLFFAIGTLRWAYLVDAAVHAALLAGILITTTAEPNT